MPCSAAEAIVASMPRFERSGDATSRCGGAVSCKKSVTKCAMPAGLARRGFGGQRGAGGKEYLRGHATDFVNCPGELRRAGGRARQARPEENGVGLRRVEIERP